MFPTHRRTAESNLLDARCRSADTTSRWRDADGENSELGGDAGHVRTAPRGTDGEGRRDLESEGQEGGAGRRETGSTLPPVYSGRNPADGCHPRRFTRRCPSRSALLRRTKSTRKPCVGYAAPIARVPEPFSLFQESL